MRCCTVRENPTLLHVACRYGMLSLVKAIVEELERGECKVKSVEKLSALVHVKDKAGHTCLDIADSNQCLEIANYLREYLVSISSICRLRSSLLVGVTVTAI